ncbi:MAG: glycoside hydrolase family 3 C-terminal domain-containing protein [Saprospiraceae bacterium]|jgi:beta-glucosidase|nr:glycoside hydrolase family 3 C-terminal domain-containing protein [Saprospiraceae bacterium]
MKIIKYLRLPALLVVAFMINVFAVQNDLLVDPPKDKTIEQKIDSVLARMTLEEKIGQLTLFTSDWDVTGPTVRENYKADIKAGKVGAIFNAHTAAFNRELQRIAVEETRLGIPLLFGYDVIHGYKTIFPIPLGEAASWDLEAIEKSSRVAAVEASAAGLHWTYAPMVDIARDPRWGRICEGAGEDTYLGSVIAAARVKGFQGKDLAADNTLAACVKHYAAYGAAQAGRDYHTVDMSERVLREVYLPPFKAAKDAGVRTFMTSFNELDGVPATANGLLLTDILRKEWGFNGFVVTDYTSINEMVDHGSAANEKDAGEQAINAGVDMDMQGAVFYNYLAQSVKEGKVNVKTIDEAVRRILRIKFELGLFDDPYRYSDVERERRLVMSPEHQEIARDVSRKSIVLLKNERQALPLNKTIGTLAVVGPLADNKSELIGSWSAAGDYTKSVSLLEGIRAKIGPGTSLLHVKGCEVEGADKSGFEAALVAAAKADAVVLAIGEKAQMSGEAASRAFIDLPGVQQDLVKALAATGKPLIVVLMNGRPLAVPEVHDKASAILETWFLGTQAGHAIADVLFGDYNPSGKLPVTFPRNLGQVPIFYNMKNTGRPMDPNDKYTSKYLDSPNTPLYPFGYGLSYTTFKYGVPVLSKNSFKASEQITVTVPVTNTGTRGGEEVVQLYVRDLVGSVTRPVKELVDFRKVMLKAGEKKEVVFKLSADQLKFYDRQLKWVAEPGEFDVMVGGNSAEVQSVRITLK